MSGVGILVTVGANAALLGGGAAAINWATGGMGEDSAREINKAVNVQVKSGEEQKATLASAFDQQLTRAQPYMQAGERGVGGLGAFQGAGVDAVAMQRALAGLDGPEAQQQAVAMLEQSPQFAAMLQQGENAILQNASATGGLRGGNTQAALAQFRPALLSSLIEQQYARLGGLAGAGQSAASNLAGIGQSTMMGTGQLQAGYAGSIADVLGAQGAYRAGGILGAQQARMQGRQQAIDYGLQAGGMGAGLLGKVATGGAL
jgi:hypothetical protein